MLTYRVATMTSEQHFHECNRSRTSDSQRREGRNEGDEGPGLSTTTDRGRAAKSPSCRLISSFIWPREIGPLRGSCAEALTLAFWAGFVTNSP
jgi:hypothetical protein